MSVTNAHAESPELMSKANVDFLSKQYVVFKDHPETIVTVFTTDTVGDIFRKLVHHNIQSAPLFDGDTGEIVGFVDLMDMLRHIVDTTEDQVLKSYLHGGREALKGVLETPASALANSSKLNPFRGVASGSSVAQVMRELSYEGVRRVAITNPSDARQVLGVCTQSWLTRWLRHNMDKLHTNVSLRELGVSEGGKSTVVCVKHNEMALRAFVLMLENNVSSVGIQDAAGELVGSIATRDLRVLVDTSSDEIDLAPLFEDVISFVGRTRRSSNGSSGPNYPTLTCTPESTVGEALKVLCACRAHRLYVVDQYNQPISVCSLRDLIGVLLEL